MYTQGTEAGRGFNELHQEVRHRQGGLGHSLDHPPCSDKSQNSGFLRKSIFLILEGPWNFFWPPKTLFGLKNLTFGGVLLLKLFDPSYGFGDFQCWLCQKIGWNHLKIQQQILLLKILVVVIKSFIHMTFATSWNRL